MNIRILIVDDDRDLLSLVEKYLMRKHPDLEVVSTISAQDALRFLEESSFDAVVCDFFLGPGQMTGLELLEWLRSSGNDMPFVMFTGRSREEVAIRALNLGADFYLKKDQSDFEGLFTELVHHLRRAVKTRHMQDALSKSEARFRIMFEEAPIGAFRMDLDGKITDVNHSLTEILGYSADELIGTNVSELYSIGESSEEAILRTEMIEGKRDSYRVEKRFSSKEEKTIWGRYIVSIVRDLTNAPQFAIGMIEDITEQRTSQVALKQSEERYRTLFNDSPISLWEEDFSEVKQLMDSLQADGVSDIPGYLESHPEFVAKCIKRVKVIDMNTGTLEMFEAQSSDILISRFQETLMDEVQDVFKNEFIAFWEGKKRYESELRARTLKGREMDLRLSAFVTPGSEETWSRVLAAIINITEQKSNQEALRESELRYRTIVQSIRDLIFVLDEDDVFSEFHSTESDYPIAPPETFLGKHITEVLPEIISKPYLSLVKEVRITGQRRSFDYSLTIDGEEKWFIANIDPHEESTGVIVTVVDITKRKLAEEELKLSERAWRDTFDSIGDAVSVHDLDFRIVKANKALAKLVGKDIDELIGKHCYEVFHGIDQPRSDCLFTETKKTKTMIIREYDEPKLGCPLLVSTSPIFNEKDEMIGVVHIARDVTDKRKSEEAVRVSEENYRRVVEESLQSIAIYQDGRFVYANPAYSQMIGYSHEKLLEFTNEEVWSLIHPEDRKEFTEQSQHVIDGEQTSQRFRFIRGDGAICWAESSSKAIEFNGQSAVMVFSIDITERKTTEDTLYESEKRFRNVFESIQLGMHMYEVDSAGNLVFIDSNPAADRILGVDCKSFIGMTLEEAFPPFSGTEVPDRYRDAALKGIPWHAEEIQYDHGEIQGAYEVTAFQTTQGRMVATFFDITERKRAEKALQQSEERYRTLFEAAPIAMSITDYDGSFRAANRYMEELTGYSWDELKLLHASTLYLDPRDRDPKISTLQGSGSLRNYEVVLRRKDGTTFQGLLNEDIIDLEGDFVILSAVRDISGLKAVESALRESEEQYRNTLDSLGTAIYVIDAEYVVVLLNPAYETWLHELKQETDVLGKNVFDAFSFLPDEASEEYKHVFETARILPTYDHLMIDGREIICETRKIPIVRDGKVTQVVTVLRDITEERRTQEELLKSRENMQILFDSIDDFLFISKMDGEILQMNRVVIERLGYSEDELVGESVLILHPPERRDEAVEILKEIIIGKTTICPLPLQAKDKTIIPVDTRITHGKWSGQDVLFGVSRDISERVKAEEILRFTQFAIDHTSEAAFWMNPDANFIYVNEQACRSLGYSQEELLSMTVHDIDPEFTSDIWPGHWKEVKEKKSFTVESTHKTKDGVLFPVEVTVNYVEFGGSEYNCAFARDISEQKKAIDVIKDSERKHRLLVKSLQDIVFVFDADNRFVEYYAPSDGFLYAPPTEFLGKSISEVLPPNVSEPFIELTRTVRSSGKLNSLTYSLDVDGHEKWFEAKLSLHEDGTSIVSVVRDITEHRITEIHIEQQRDFLEKVIESLTHPFYVIDASDYSIVLANESARIRPGDGTCYELTHNSEIPCDGIEYPCPLLEVKRTRKPTVVEHRHVDYRGVTRTYLVHGFPILNEVGDVVQMIEYNLDVTEQKETFEQIKRQKEELSTFAHQMSHDLNNYLLKIDGATKVIESEHESSITISRLIREVHELLQHSITLADAGLVIEKKDSVNLDTLVGQMAESHIPDGIAYQQEPLPVVLADRTKLAQVFQNLFDNAVKHGSPNRIEVRSHLTETSLSIVIANDGAPIPEIIRSTILSRGLTSKRDQRGFGLAIVRRIIEAHDWTIELLESPETAFAIIIPISEIVKRK